MKKKKKRILALFFLLLVCIILCKILCINRSEINNIRQKILETYEGMQIYQKEKNAEYIIEGLEDKVTYDSNVIITLIINSFETGKEYKLQCIVEDETYTYAIKETKTEITIENLANGENSISFQLEKENEIVYNYSDNIYYIREYDKQFLDEFNKRGFSMRFGDEWTADNPEKLEMLKRLGIKYSRNEIRWDLIETKKGEYNFSKSDKWISALYNNNIEPVIVLGAPPIFRVGGDFKISNQEDLDEFLEYVRKVQEQYPQVKEYELMNEPNASYTTEEDLKWYAKTAIETSKLLKSINNDINLKIGATMTPDIDQEDRRSSEVFLEKISNFGVYNVATEYSYHLYDYNRSATLNNRFKEISNRQQRIKTQLGGFIKLSITETGIPTAVYSYEEQMNQIVQQQVLIDEYNLSLGLIYSFSNRGTDLSKTEHTYGIVNNSYIPKNSYFTLKTFFENTNGSEYIGTVNLADGLEAHVYDKDGKPKIITWATNEDKSITIDYQDFTAKDLYGEDIENTNGKLEITTSPVYLDNISTKYFYQAISNTALEKYTEFEEKFATEISKVEGLQQEINSLKQYMQGISNIESESENIAKQKMEEHFNLGNQILEAYKNGKLDIEYVKLSSMLDMLNDIGDSYEDLVTVSSVTRNPDLQGTKVVIDSTEQEINNNSDIEIIYPTKILEFSKDLYEKAEYINNLEEENDIKTGLIVSYNLHAKYLADWANIFTNIYIDEYIEANPITVSYSETNLTNKDVVATLNIGEDVQITNNSEKNTYTFTSNGTFTFEYNRRGRTFKQETKVENIDKTIPVISGIEEGTTYANHVTPQVSDEHLKEVQLILNGEPVQNYKPGNEISEEGKYELLARDSAGNEAKVTFEIKYKTEIESEEYEVDGQYIIGVKQNTTLEKFTDILNSNDEYKVYRDDKLLDNKETVATGDKIETEYGETFYIIVKGDITKDGITNIKDLVKIRRNILGLEKFDEFQKMAADLAEDETINIKDLVRIRRIILGLEV